MRKGGLAINSVNICWQNEEEFKSTPYKIILLSHHKFCFGIPSVTVVPSPISV